MVQRKQLIIVAMATLAVTSFAASAQARHRQGYSGYRWHSLIPTYYPGPPRYPGPAFYGPLRYGSPYGGYYYRDRYVYRPYW